MTETATTAAFDRYPQFSLSLGEANVYQYFRHREPALVSCLDHDADNQFFSTSEVLALRYHETAVGVASVAIGTNLCKARPRNCCGRIDLVIVEREFRRFGLGRILVLAALDYLLDCFGETLYSISCLAAHEAIRQIMHSEIDFRIGELACRNFTPISVELPKLESLEFRREVHMALEKAVKLAAYRLRQKNRVTEASSKFSSVLSSS